MNNIIENEEFYSQNSSINTSDNINDNNKRVKRTRNRASKAEKYVEERVKLLDELNKIIGLENNNKIILYDLEHNEELKIYLKEKISLIKKIFKTCTWGYFSNELKKGMGNEIGLLRAIYKNEGLNISSKRKICKRENEKKLLVELHFNK